nr:MULTISPECIES: hypothetical protein [unclassified Haloferax]
MGRRVAEARRDVRRQGRLDESFVQTVVDALEAYLESPTEG